MKANNFPYHTFELRETKPIKVVIRPICDGITEAEIFEELSAKEYKVLSWNA